MPEIEGSGAWSIEAGKTLTITRQYLIPWGSQLSFVASWIGQPDPVFPIAHCKSADVEPVGRMGAGEPAVYEWAKVKLKFQFEAREGQQNSTPSTGGGGGGGGGSPQFPPGVSIKVQARGSGEFLEFPARLVRYESNSSGNPNALMPAEESTAGVLFIPIIDWTVTLQNVVLPNTQALHERLGRVNSDLFMGFPIETVLFESYDADWDWTLDNGQARITWSIAYHFKVRAIQISSMPPVWVGWNHDFHPAVGWQRAFIGGPGNNRYMLTTFSDIFTATALGPGP